MGIRYEKDSILNWINEMGKFLRLLVDKYDAFEKIEERSLDEDGYQSFFGQSREFFVRLTEQDLKDFVGTIQMEQIRPLAQLMMYDGLHLKDRSMLEKAKFLFNYHMQVSGSFSFEDYRYLDKIEKGLTS
ncbi:hypothetical protein GQF61_10950 [Sphingobacterium sp. DK4209]|uniref:Uncharacterized protein n=1 Tax=Sphingobacterium zhuxiongii TaxID=2662364 RepID=A0A5Q0Q8J1_9SPHI|nr:MULTISPECIES: hypothetical protein [unclassified Sphingobacterium]MVZ66376.1 hypothetical protein [Sphingobacterium sp. DK4209]QGA25151.1 hypothetical protein GFH32_01920 [Sphingobacterium sp. dk4302]